MYALFQCLCAFFPLLRYEPRGHRASRWDVETVEDAVQALKGKKGGDTGQGMTGILSWDEMELCEGLLFNVSTGEMVGFGEIDVEARRRSLADPRQGGGEGGGGGGGSSSHRCHWHSCKEAIGLSFYKLRVYGVIQLSSGIFFYKRVER